MNSEPVAALADVFVQQVTACIRYLAATISHFVQYDKMLPSLCVYPPLDDISQVGTHNFSDVRTIKYRYSIDYFYWVCIEIVTIVRQQKLQYSRIPLQK